MNFNEDVTWQDDPDVSIADITTGGSYALSVNGSFNAASINLNGIDISTVFVRAQDTQSNIVTNFLTVNSNIISSNLYVSNIFFSNSINQIGTTDINFKGNVNIGISTDKNKNLFVGGFIKSTSNIIADSNIITSNIITSNINNSGNFYNAGNLGIGTTNKILYKIDNYGILNSLLYSSNGIILDFNSYATSNLIFDYFYTSEQKYPFKEYESSTTQIISNFISFWVKWTNQ
jgi:hypothetical protein